MQLGYKELHIQQNFFRDFVDNRAKTALLAKIETAWD